MIVTIPDKNGGSENIQVYDINRLIDRLERRDGHTHLFTFDIEVTTSPDYTRSWMWVFQVCHEGVVYIGRYWSEYTRWVNALCKGDRIYIHNLSYEWAFIKDVHTWTKILSRNERKIISATTDRGIEYRCTYALTSKSLAKLAADSPAVTLSKQTGELDYSLYRTPLTPIHQGEYRYIVADVYILYQYLHAEFSRMPYTRTGYVRRDIRNSTRKDEEFSRYRRKTELPYSIFDSYKHSFIGGDVHANEKYIGELIHTYNYDITSSYPYRMIKDVYPYGRTIRSRTPVDDIRVADRTGILYVATVVIHDIQLQSWNHYPTISASKCRKRSVKTTLSNGRVIRSEFIVITLTSIDIDIVKKNYIYSSMDIIELYLHSDKRLLPNIYRERILNFYRKKTELKGVQGREAEYQLAKENVNSVYGMTVTYPIQRNILYNNGVWTEDTTPEPELYSNYIDRSSVAPYTIGIWTTAYARQDLDNVRHMSDPVYWDTDSIKSRVDISGIIADINARRERELSRMYDIDDYSPKDIHGQRHCIGLWDYEGESDLITWGSKKYAYYTPDGTPHVTVAGLSKRGAQQYIIDNQLKITDITDNTIIPPEYSGRMTATYVDNLEPLTHPDGSITTDKSCVVLQPTSYTFNSSVNIINTVVLGSQHTYVMGGNQQ